MFNRPMFKVGDVVQLKSGGPRMTVVVPDNDQCVCQCYWHDKQNNLKLANFVFDVVHNETQENESQSRRAAISRKNIWDLGSVVTLKSGSVKMTVTQFDREQGTVHCAWFTTSDELLPPHEIPILALQDATEETAADTPTVIPAR